MSSVSAPSAPRLPATIRKMLGSRMALLRRARSVADRLSIAGELQTAILEAVQELSIAQREIRAALGLDPEPAEPEPAPKPKPGQALLASSPSRKKAPQRVQRGIKS